MLKKEADITIVTSCDDNDFDISMLTEYKPNIILLDLSLTEKDSFDLVNSIKHDHKDIKVIVMDLIPLQEDILRYVEAGVSGFIMKNDNMTEFLKTIRSVSAGEKISCGANVSINDLLGIKGLEKSPNVYLLTSLSPITWIQMVVVPKGFTYQTKGTNVDVLIELEYPQEYTLANG